MLHHYQLRFLRFKNANEQAIWLSAHPSCLLHSITTKPARLAHPRDVLVYQFVGVEACAQMKTYLRKHKMPGHAFRDYGARARKKEREKRKIQKMYFDA